MRAAVSVRFQHHEQSWRLRGAARGNRAAGPLLGLPREDRGTLCDPGVRWRVVAPRPAISRRVLYLLRKGNCSAPWRGSAQRRSGSPPLYPPPHPTRALEPREGFADVVWAQEISEQLPGEQHYPEQAGEGSWGAAPWCVCLCRSRFLASPKRGTWQPPGTRPCHRFTLAPQLFPGCGRSGQAGVAVTVQGSSLCPRCGARLRAVLVAHGPSPAPGHAPLGVGPVGRFTHVPGEPEKLKGWRKGASWGGIIFSPLCMRFPTLCARRCPPHHTP